MVTNNYLTVFTPIFNRAYIIDKLYQSLLRQTCNNFEWLIVDDGSTDDIKEKIKKYQSENKITIHYFYKENGGKHTAINLGVREALGELFFIVDSDDYLADNAVERIIYHYINIKDIDSFAGVSGLKASPNGVKIGSPVDWKVLDSNSIDLQCKQKVFGDMAEVYKTSILRQFPFPVLDKEKFISECIVWDQIAEKYKLRYFSENIYICEYLKDGLSSNSIRLRANSPKSALLVYENKYFNHSYTFLHRIRSGINYWRFVFWHLMKYKKKPKLANISKLFLFFGIFMFLKDYMEINK